MSQNEDYLNDELMRLEQALTSKSVQLAEALGTIDRLETLLHKAARIAGHIPFLCRELPEVSVDLDNAAMQLQRLLVLRET